MSFPETTRLACPPGPPAADAYLRSIGICVEPQDIPGLYRINGGPELTYGQMLGELGRMVAEAPQQQFAATFAPRPCCPKCDGWGTVGGFLCECVFPRDSDGKPQ